MSGKELFQLGRAAAIAVAMVATSGALQITGQPFFTIVDQIALNVATAQSELKKLREKATTLLIAKADQSPDNPKYFGQECPC